MTQQTDFRVLCAELLSRLEESDDYILKEEGTIALADRARAALAQPSDVGLLELMPQQFREDLATVSRMAAHGAGTGVTPGLFRVSLNTGALDYARAVLARYGHQPAPPAVGEGVTDDEIERRFQVWWYDEGSGMPPGADEDSEAHVHRVSQIAWRNGAYVARYGHQPAPPAEGEVAELAVFLRGCADDHHGHGRRQFTRAADLLEQRRPAPVAEGEVAELMEWLKAWALAFHRVEDYVHEKQADRVADMLAQRHPAPVAVSERLPDASDPRECRMPDGSCWWFDPHEDGAWYFDAYQGNYTHWLPAHALPLPQGEVK